MENVLVSRLKYPIYLKNEKQFADILFIWQTCHELGELSVERRITLTLSMLILSSQTDISSVHIYGNL
jgi:hypothetical protein